MRAFIVYEMVGAAGFELATLCSQSRCATRLRYAPTKRGFYIGRRGFSAALVLRLAKQHFLFRVGAHGLAQLGQHLHAALHGGALADAVEPGL